MAVRNLISDRYIVLPLLLASALCGGAEAQEVRQFHPKGFVADLLKDDATKASNTTSEPSDSTVAGDAGMSGGTTSVVGTRSEVRALVAQVYVNSQDKAHFDAVYQRMLALHRAGRMRFGSLMYVGTFKNISEVQHQELQSEGIFAMAAFSFPEGLSIAQSPSWVISDGQKHYVIEGEMRPDSFFSSKGVFVPPVGMAVEDTPEEREKGELKEF